VASGDGAEGSIEIRQDIRLYATHLEKGREIAFSIASDRHAWLQVIRGALSLNGQPLSSGDGAAVSEEKALRIAADEDSEFLLFDLP